MYDTRISESCVDPNRLMVARQDPDNFPRFQTRERCALEIAAYVFKTDRRMIEILNHTIWNSEYVPERIFEKSSFWKQHMTLKKLPSIQRVKDNAKSD